MIIILPDFPSFKSKIERSTINYVNENIHNEPLLFEMKKKQCFEGKGFSFVDDTGDLVEREFEKTVSEFSVGIEEVLERGPVLCLEKFLELMNDFQTKIINKFFEEVEIATSKTGNQFDASEKLITEVNLKGLEKMNISFDEDGNPFLPTWFMNPSDILKHKKILEEHLKENPDYMKEYEKRLGKIIEIKRNEWNDRESNRKLVG